jgi:hypothetical protein
VNRSRIPLISPESRLNVRFVNGLNETAQVMAKHLAKHFVSLRDGRLAAESFTELGFNLRLIHQNKKLMKKLVVRVRILHKYSIADYQD